MWIGAYCLTYYLSYYYTDQRPYTTAKPKMPVCMHCFSLSRCFYCLGYTAHHKATNTASQPTEERVIVLYNCWLILLTLLPCFYSIALTKLIFIIWQPFQAVNLFYAFINYCKMVCNSLFFTHHLFTKCTDNLCIYTSWMNLTPFPKSFKCILYLILLMAHSFFLTNLLIIELPQAANLDCV